jgi:hypothetical protein
MLYTWCALNKLNYPSSIKKAVYMYNLLKKTNTFSQIDINSNKKIINQVTTKNNNSITQFSRNYTILLKNHSPIVISSITCTNKPVRI